MSKTLRSERDEAYARVWNAVRGGIRDFRNAHPDEIMPEGDREASLVKRIVGQIESLAERWCGDAPQAAGNVSDPGSLLASEDQRDLDVGQSGGRIPTSALAPGGIRQSAGGAS